MLELSALEEFGIAVGIVTGLGTVVFEGTIAWALMTERYKFKSERVERDQRNRRNVVVSDPKINPSKLYGFRDLIGSIEDLIDCVRAPENYPGLSADNEILIFGPSLSGKTAVAKHIAQEAGIDRMITNYNVRDVDGLAYVDSLLQPDATQQWLKSRNLTRRIKDPSDVKTMIFFPGLDQLNGPKGKAFGQVEHLIETCSENPNILVVGTAKNYNRYGEVASWFGTALAIPIEETEEDRKMEAKMGIASSIAKEGMDPPRVKKSELEIISYGKLNEALDAGSILLGIEEGQFISSVIAQAINPAEIEDIVRHCRKRARYEQLQAKTNPESPIITPEILSLAIRRVIPYASFPVPAGAAA